MYCGQPDQLLDLNWNQGKGPGNHLESAMSSLVPSRSPAAADGMTFHKRLDINNGELMNGREESSASDPAASEEVSSRGPSKKRKAPPKDKVMGPGIATSSIDPSNAMKEEDPSAKRCRSMEKKGTETDAVKPKAEENDGCSSNGYNGQKQGKENSSKSAEPLKGYIHVRSRRGQATDSHSLAERVRREKISQRMKLLQDLVPGCNKVTGKAVMLDEIINYVQSLQRQVEFLSMKIATLNPQLDFNLETLLPKMQQACEPMTNSVYALETSEATTQHINRPQQGTFLHCVLPNDMEIHNSLNILEPKFYGSTSQPFIYGFDTTSSQFQLGSFWEDDLQNAACMDIGHN